MYTPLHKDYGINEKRIKNFKEDKVLRNYVAENATFDCYNMTNVDAYRKYYYNVNLRNIHARFYINNGIVSGIFDSVFFSCESIDRSGSFWDECIFKNCTFINCKFGKVDIRWCKFDNCKFIGCTGTINYIRASTFKKNCSFVDSDIKIEQVDEYFFMNSKRYKKGNMQLCEK